MLTESYELRDYQRSLAEFIYDSIKTGQGAAIEAPTGSGKTLTGLAAAIRHATESGKKILYLTRTNSQQEQVIKELRIMAPHLGIKAVPIQGRYNLCPLYMEIESGEGFTADSLSRFCNGRKKKVREGDRDACRFYNDNVRSEKIMVKLFGEIPTAEEFFRYGKENLVCPYESLKHAASRADLVIAPYAFYLNPDVAERFLSRWGVSRENLVIILDEAHNLPDLAREASSFSISMRSINLSEKELQEYGDPELAPHFRASDFCETLRNGILDLVRDKLDGREEARIRFSDFAEYAAIGARIKVEQFWIYASLFALVGDNICNIKEQAGKVPRSHVLSLSSRILGWRDSEDQSYVAILNNENSGTLQAFCLEPTRILENLKISRTIHMSGTLEPFDTYKKITGFTELATRKVGGVFPEENRLVLYYDGVSTKYDEFDDAAAERMRDMIENLISSTGRKTLVFFTSYSMMERITGAGFNFRYLSETRENTQNELMSMLATFRRKDMPLFAVMGGRVSEGMNFPGNELQMVILAGVPYPRPDAKQKALYAYYQNAYNRGWEYSVTFPVVVRMRQAIGRLIRGEDDTGVALILDRRASYFRKYIPEMKLSHSPADDVSAFFSSHPRLS